MAFLVMTLCWDSRCSRAHSCHVCDARVGVSNSHALSQACMHGESAKLSVTSQILRFLQRTAADVGHVRICFSWGDSRARIFLKVLVLPAHEVYLAEDLLVRLPCSWCGAGGWAR